MNTPYRMAAPAAETRRRELLEESDRMLDHVELLRLDDETVTPPLLVLRMRRLLQALGRHEPAGLDRLGAFHDLLFAVQQRLMAGNPKRLATRTHAGRAPGTPVILPIGPRAKWKHLTLPIGVGVEEEAGFEAWLDLVDATVERALDRWNWALWHAIRCARDSTRRDRAGAALALAVVAWDNYWELAEEAAELRTRSAAAGGSAPVAAAG